ncbi:TetR/AcrR family transcriptional regulator [Haloechinothrix sp. LS1_15]|nr:TetR/AcrR family transcriptional regulator [Haloechinothrix sp. LS1_15]
MIRAGERLFAARGVDGALTRDIVAEAGQSNGSAVHYHFGSRAGLLRAISAKHVRRMEAERAEHLRSLDHDGQPGQLHPVVHGILAPTAAALHTADGRDFLRIIAQLAGYAGIRATDPPDPLPGTRLQRQLELLVDCCATRMPEPLARERVATVVAMLASTLADRARQLEEGVPLLLEHAAFVNNLTGMIVGALEAPLP